MNSPLLMKTTKSQLTAEQPSSKKSLEPTKKGTIKLGLPATQQNTILTWFTTYFLMTTKSSSPSLISLLTSPPRMRKQCGCLK